MPKATVNGIQIYYEVRGEGPDLWLIAGYTSHRMLWSELLPYLGDFRVTIVENRGAGESDSPPPPYTMPQMADDVAGLMEVLSVERAQIFGHSMGGSIAQELAIEHPEKVEKLFLCSTSACFAPLFKRLIVALRRAMEGGVDPKLMVPLGLPWIYSNNFLADDAKYNEALQQRFSNPFPQTPDGNKGQLEALLSFDARDRLHRIKAPTHIIAGAEDLYCPLADTETLHKGIPNSTLTVIPKMGHGPILEVPKLVADEIRFKN